MLKRGFFGYLIEKEDRNFLSSYGGDPKILLSSHLKKYPPINPKANPLSLLSIRDQGQVSSCAGNSLAAVFDVCFFLATGRFETFSAACGYYMAQSFDGIKGDRGSTLSGCNKVATQHGMCLEKDWPYKNKYDPQKPRGISFPYKISVSQPFKDVGLLWDWLYAGLPVQIGVIWDNSCDRSLVDSYDGSRLVGGHSTLFWTIDNNGNVNNINSWGKKWNDDGIHQWTKNAVEKALKNSWNVFVGYSPEGMILPDLAPV